MNLDHFGMDTITLAGPLEAKLRAVRAAGFTQIMLSAQDIVGHPGGEAAAIAAVHKSGLRVTGFQVLRDFEGLDGHLHAYKVDVAKAMLEMCRALRSRILLVCSSASAHATGDTGRLVKDLQKRAMLAVPLDIRIAYEALSWGRHVHEYTQAWDIVQSAGRENLGLALDSFHIHANRTALDLVLGGRRVLLGHRLEILDARELAVAVLVGLLELLGELRVGRGFCAGDVAVLVLVERVEAGIVGVFADLVFGIAGADCKRERRGDEKER